MRIGPSFSTISADDASTKAGNSHVGLNVGVVAGLGLAADVPLYFETGLFYTEKGGESNLNGDKWKYNLDYLLVPITFKYAFSPDDDNFSIQPFFGFYGACGVGGKIKNYDSRTATSSFDNQYRRLDCGLRFGCGVAYEPFYLELSYDLGLADISDDSFDNAHTRSLLLNFGVNF